MWSRPSIRETWRDHIKVSRSEEHTSELQSLAYLVCRLLLEKKKKKQTVFQPHQILQPTQSPSYEWVYGSTPRSTAHHSDVHFQTSLETVSSSACTRCLARHYR